MHIRKPCRCFNRFLSRGCGSGNLISLLAKRARQSLALDGGEIDHTLTLNHCTRFVIFLIS